ncbi:hypothetical protein HDV64DRAFT_34057 [Trichoderma sp. TUCIM 5745]
MIQAARLWKLGRVLCRACLCHFYRTTPLLLLSDRAPSSFSASAIANSHVSTLLGWVLPCTGSGGPSIAGTTDQVVGIEIVVFNSPMGPAQWSEMTQACRSKAYRVTSQVVLI